MTSTPGPIERQLSEQLQGLAAAYQAATGFEMSTIAQRAAGDWRFFDRLFEADSTFTLRKADAVITWFDANWPDGVRWPKGVPRPKAEASA